MNTQTTAQQAAAFREYGLTNDRAHYGAAVAWREAAAADGWSIQPTYKNEPAECHATMERDGFKAHVMARDGGEDHGGKYRYKAKVSIWGPDRMAVEPPMPYDWAAVVAGLRVCGECGARDVETEKVAFANRCCAECAPEARRKLETPGWCN